MATLTQKAIKVNRLKLIAALEAALGKGDGDYRQRLAEYETRYARARTELAKRMEQLAAKPADLDLDHSSYERTLSYTVSSKTKVPPKPRDVLCDLRNTIAVLRLSDEQDVTISGEQYSAYFPCGVE